MNSIALTEALVNLKNLKEFIESFDKKENAIKSLLESDAEKKPAPAYEWAENSAKFTSARIYDYVTTIVLLYGILERFIEEVASEYIQKIVSNTSKYSKLPLKFQQSHFDATVLHLQRTKDSRYDGTATASELTKALSGCLEDIEPYYLISESLIHHTANFRVPVINDFFSRFDIEAISKKAADSELFLSFFDENDLPISKDKPEAALDLINELVAHRNQVAHGDLNNSLGPSILLPMTQRVDIYIRSLDKILSDYMHVDYVLKKGKLLGNPIKVIDDNIVCINSLGSKIEIGTKLVIFNTRKIWSIVEVKEMQVENKPVVSLNAGQNINVGMKIDGRCKITYTVWGPN